MESFFFGCQQARESRRPFFWSAGGLTTPPPLKASPPPPPHPLPHDSTEYRPPPRRRVLRHAYWNLLIGSPHRFFTSPTGCQDVSTPVSSEARVLSPRPRKQASIMSWIILLGTKNALTSPPDDMQSFPAPEGGQPFDPRPTFPRAFLSADLHEARFKFLAGFQGSPCLDRRSSFLC